MNKSIQIFKPGKHTAMSGAALSFSETDLAATAQAYDPARHEAPLVCGHPAHDAPAYGWVSGLSFASGALEAEATQVDSAFAEMVAQGSFKKVSASFYAPDSPSNPVPGVYYLRHVGFLGALPPAVKGLRNPSFADAEQGVVEFAEWDDVDNASLWRGLYEWIIGKFGLAEADKAVPGYTVKNLEQSAQDELKKSVSEVSAGANAFAEKQEHYAVTKESQSPEVTATAFAEPHLLTLGDEMSIEEKTQLAALQAENAALKAKQAEFVEAEQKRATAARHAAHVAFAESLVNEGRLLAVSCDVTVAALDLIAAQDVAVEFGEGAAKQPLLEAYKATLQASPVLVEFGEVAGAGQAMPQGVVNFAAPAGHTVDADALLKLATARAYMDKHHVSFETAITALEG